MYFSAVKKKSYFSAHSAVQVFVKTVVINHKHLNRHVCMCWLINSRLRTICRYGHDWFWTKLNTPGYSGSLVVASRQLFNRVPHCHFTFNKNTTSTNGAYFTGLVRRCVRGIIVTSTSQERISAMLLLLITGN
jgi:hypothetical protein